MLAGSRVEMNKGMVGGRCWQPLPPVDQIVRNGPAEICLKSW